MLAGLLVGTVRAEPATAATAGTVVFGPKCPDVMVIATEDLVSRHSQQNQVSHHNLIGLTEQRTGTPAPALVLARKT